MPKGLGRGLGALFESVEISEDDQIRELELEQLRPNPYQPRKVFAPESIAELKESIQNHGILQPLIVRRSIKGFEIVVGERRFRAAREADFKTVPVVVRDLDEQKMMELALIENLQREDLNPVEEAQAYQKLMEGLQLTQEELGARLGKSRPHIANHLRLLHLTEPVRDAIAAGQLSMGHGRALLGLKDETNQKPVLDRIFKEKLNVRQLETLIQQWNQNVPRETKPAKKQSKDVVLQEKEAALRERFGTDVLIRQAKRKGKIEIAFYSDDDLNRVLELLEGQPE